MLVVMKVASVLRVIFKKQCSDILSVKKPLFVADYEKDAILILISYLCHSRLRWRYGAFEHQIGHFPSLNIINIVYTHDKELVRS